MKLQLARPIGAEWQPVLIPWLSREIIAAFLRVSCHLMFRAKTDGQCLDDVQNLSNVGRPSPILPLTRLHFRQWLHNIYIQT
jgi:hypothetical protein